jgi:hypothetical protein
MQSEPEPKRIVRPTGSTRISALEKVLQPKFRETFAVWQESNRLRRVWPSETLAFPGHTAAPYLIGKAQFLLSCQYFSHHSFRNTKIDLLVVQVETALPGRFSAHLHGLEMFKIVEMARSHCQIELAEPASIQ